jgi:hypothetical protein
MNKFRFTLTALAIMAFTLMVSSSTQAQAPRTWVSGVGDDVNPCSRTAPCKTFAGAIIKTDTNGEIDVLDPGGFGPLTINKSITIDGSSIGSGGMVNPSGHGVVINIVSASDTRKSVTLRNLSIQGVGTGLRGVRIFAATQVYVENCLITGQSGSPGNGIDDARTTGGFLEVDNTTITNNSGSAINVAPSSGATQIHVHVTNSRLQGNGGTGLALGNNVKGTISNSVIAQNGAGFSLSSTVASAELAVEHCVVSNNVTGFIAQDNSIIRVSNSTAMFNSTLATLAGNGAVSSYVNNQTGGLPFPSTPTGQQ